MVINMEYSEFARKAVLQDERNVFSAYEGSLEEIPDVLKTFYKENNPSDVEINAVRFFPAEELSGLQEEYSYLKAQFVFATCNGDPVFMHDGNIYTCPHGAEAPEWEPLAADFKGYLDWLLEE